MKLKYVLGIVGIFSLSVTESKASKQIENESGELELKKKFVFNNRFVGSAKKRGQKSSRITYKYGDDSDKENLDPQKKR